jgi:predicted GNAT family N-acyltransferase
MDEQSPPYPMVGLLFFMHLLTSHCSFPFLHLQAVNTPQFHTIKPLSAAYEEMVNLRMEVLLDPIGIPRSYINPEKEAEDLLLGAYNSEVLVGCCILTKIDETTVQLRQMAVAAAMQKAGVGRLVLSFAENLAKEKGFRTLVMHARDSVIPFYQKCGYSISGNRFFEVGIPHHKMQKELLAESL